MLFSATVPNANQLFELLSLNPKLAYLLSATLLLAGMALAAGLVRRDFEVLGDRFAALKVVLAVLGAVALVYAGDALQGSALPAGSGAGWHTDVSRLPLYLVALAYGPTLGLLMGVAYVATSGMSIALDGIAVNHLALDPQSGVLVLELAVIGWLAIYPSPAHTRWAGPFNALVAYSLAWLTGGLTLLELGPDPISLEAIVDQQKGPAVGVLITAAALVWIGPARYRRWFPESRIHRSAPETTS